MVTEGWVGEEESEDDAVSGRYLSQFLMKNLTAKKKRTFQPKGGKESGRREEKEDRGGG